ncbi:MAG: hypothetical protein B6D45_09875 [Ignavibacteriales bacterium UTCHB3]|nr:MAG: hypothetical protein B6D45_09875 [Ignavibacteriales bacterium UTCHB3]
MILPEAGTSAGYQTNTLTQKNNRPQKTPPRQTPTPLHYPSPKPCRHFPVYGKLNPIARVVQNC